MFTGDRVHLLSDGALLPFSLARSVSPLLTSSVVAGPSVHEDEMTHGWMLRDVAWDPAAMQVRAVVRQSSACVREY